VIPSLEIACEVPIFCVNKELRIEEWNQKIEQLTGSPGPRHDDGMMGSVESGNKWLARHERHGERFCDAERKILIRCCIYKHMTYIDLDIYIYYNLFDKNYHLLG
jgi:hypothetical protein